MASGAGEKYVLVDPALLGIHIPPGMRPSLPVKAGPKSALKVKGIRDYIELEKSVPSLVKHVKVDVISDNFQKNPEALNNFILDYYEKDPEALNVMFDELHKSIPIEHLIEIIDNTVLADTANTNNIKGNFLPSEKIYLQKRIAEIINPSQITNAHIDALANGFISSYTANVQLPFNSAKIRNMKDAIKIQLGDLEKYYVSLGMNPNSAHKIISEIYSTVQQTFKNMSRNNNKETSYASVNWKPVPEEERGETPFPATLQLNVSASNSEFTNQANNVLNYFYLQIVKKKGPFYLDNETSRNKFKQILDISVAATLENASVPIKIGHNIVTYDLSEGLKNKIKEQVTMLKDYIDSPHANLTRELRWENRPANTFKLSRGGRRLTRRVVKSRKRKSRRY